MTISITTAPINIDDLPKWRGLEGPTQVLLLDWCKEHCQSPYRWEGMMVAGRNMRGHILATVEFENTRDAAAFKIRWG